jgi:hypothetical protein
MISVNGIATVLFAMVLALTASIRVASAAGPQITYVSATGDDGAPECPPASPCASLGVAINSVVPGGEVVCLSPPRAVEAGFAFSQSVTVDCAGTYLAAGTMLLSGVNQNVIFRHLNFDGAVMAAAGPGIELTGSVNLVLENCSFENFAAAAAIEITPSGASKVVVTNSRISNSGSGILLKPSLGFSSLAMPNSTQATLDHVTITDNSGGGIKIDTTNAAVTTDITESVVSNNAGNGINAVAPGDSQNIVSIKNSVIAENGAAGVQANGANAGVLVQTTLFDQNAAGATSLVAGGHISTYGNNTIVGSSGSGFSGTASLQ